VTSPSQAGGPTTLGIDVGGGSVKGALLDATAQPLGDVVRVPVTYPCPPDAMVGYVEQIAAGAGAKPDRVGLGFPGIVRGGRILTAPHFVTTSGPGSPFDDALVTAWDGFDLAGAVEGVVGAPVRAANDADVQGLSVVQGRGVELVITLGTGLGTALFQNGTLGPHLELSHHPFRDGESYNEQVGERARERIGDDAWRERVVLAVRTLRALTLYDTLYIGGGNSARLGPDFAEAATVVDNINGIEGCVRLWEQPHLA